MIHANTGLPFKLLVYTLLPLIMLQCINVEDVPNVHPYSVVCAQLLDKFQHVLTSHCCLQKLCDYWYLYDNQLNLNALILSHGLEMYIVHV